jgi:hypothetical protein
MHHKSIPAIRCRNTGRISFGSQKILLEEFVNTYQIQRIQNSYALASNALLVHCVLVFVKRSFYPNILDCIGSYVMHNLFTHYLFLYFKSN